MKNIFLFNSHVHNMIFFTCYLCFVIIWDTVNPNLNCSITKSLILCHKWVANASLSPIFKSPWTCRPSWLTWFYWTKHNFDACLKQIQCFNGEFNFTSSFYKAIPFFLGILCTLVASPWLDYFSIDIQFFWSCIVVLCNVRDNICEIMGTILTLVLTNSHVNQLNATYEHKLHY